MKAVSVNIDSIHIDPANLRIHSERNLAILKASLARFGQQKPIVIDSNGICRAGNATLEAARAMGWEKIEVVKTGLQGSEATAYSIVDNRPGEFGSWAESSLVETLRSLESEGIDLTQIGFDEDEIEQLARKLGKNVDEALLALNEEAESDDLDGQIPSSPVRMAYLFLTVATYPEFESIVERLGEIYGTENVTDTVLECLRRADRSDNGTA